MKFALKSINEICSEIHKDVHSEICNKVCSEICNEFNGILQNYFAFSKSCWILESFEISGLQ